LFVDQVFINIQSCNISDHDIMIIHIVISLFGEGVFNFMFGNLSAIFL